MQQAVVTVQKMRNLNVRQENAMFNLAAVQSVVPLRECKLSSLGRLALSTTLCFSSAQTQVRRCFRSSMSRIAV